MRPSTAGRVPLKTPPHPPVGTWNPGVLGSSEPTPEDPQRRGGAQGGSGSSPPSWIPNRGVQGTDDTAVILHSFRAPRRLPPTSATPWKSESGSTLSPVRLSFSPYTQTPASLCTSRSIAVREEPNLRLSSTKQDVTDGSRSPCNFLFLSCQGVFRRWS